MCPHLSNSRSLQHVPIPLTGIVELCEVLQKVFQSSGCVLPYQLDTKAAGCVDMGHIHTHHLVAWDGLFGVGRSHGSWWFGRLERGERGEERWRRQCVKEER